jgi:hypothetical protein
MGFFPDEGLLRMVLPWQDKAFAPLSSTFLRDVREQATCDEVALRCTFGTGSVKLENSRLKLYLHAIHVFAGRQGQSYVLAPFGQALSVYILY